MSLRFAEHPAFVRYWLGQTVSVVGTGVRILTVAWLILEQTGSAAWLAGAAMARVGAMLALTPWASREADRRSRTAIVLVAEAGSLLVTLSLGVASWLGSIPPIWLVAAAAALGALHAFEAPARNVLVHDLVSKDALLPALSLFSASQGAGRIIGPALGGVLLATWGPSACFFVDAASYGVLLLLVLTLPRHEPQGGDSRGGLWTTLRSALARPITRHVLLLLTVLAIIAGGHRPLIPAIAVQLLELGPDGLGALQACGALGALIAGIVLGRGDWKVSPERVLAVSTIAVGPFVALLAWQGQVLGVAAALFVASALLTAGEAAANTSLQTHAPPEERARHVGLYTILAHLFPIGGWAIAWLAMGLGLGAALIVSGAVATGLAIPLQGKIKRD